jgi:hypothetical protein
LTAAPSYAIFSDMSQVHYLWEYNIGPLGASHIHGPSGTSHYKVMMFDATDAAVKRQVTIMYWRTKTSTYSHPPDTLEVQSVLVGPSVVHDLRLGSDRPMTVSVEYARSVWERLASHGWTVPPNSPSYRAQEPPYTSLTRQAHPPSFTPSAGDPPEWNTVENT